MVPSSFAGLSMPLLLSVTTAEVLVWLHTATARYLGFPEFGAGRVWLPGEGDGQGEGRHGTSL